MSDLEPRRPSGKDVARRHIPQIVVPVPLTEAPDFVRNAASGTNLTTFGGRIVSGFFLFEPHFRYTAIDASHTRIDIDLTALLGGVGKLLPIHRRAEIDRFFVSIQDELDRREKWRPRPYVPQPTVLPSNQPRDRFYRGGARISAFRSEEDHGPNTPEDWVASTTTVRGEPVVGLSILPSGRPLIDDIEITPYDWLGAEHVARFGTDTKLLVKLLDPGQRLPIHAHPHASFAADHLGAAHGKAEAWYILSPGDVWLGLTRHVTADELAAMVSAQDVEGMLGLMHRIPVSQGDTVYVPPGLLHAIGEGVFLAEVQEPEDLSILLEWRDFDLDGERDGHLGLGFDVALQAVETRARSAAEIGQLVVHDELAAPAAEYFRLDRVQAPTSIAAGFAVLMVLDGNIQLGELSLVRGNTVVVPHAAGEYTLRGAGTALVARPPLPLGHD